MAATNDFLKTIVAIRQKGLGSHSYISRGKIWLKNYPDKLKDHPHISDLKLFDAEYNVGAVAQKLLHGHISYTEVSTCNKGCVPRFRFFPLFNVESTRISDPDFSQCIVSRKIAFDNNNCSKKGCNGKESIVASVGKFEFVSIDSAYYHTWYQPQKHRCTILAQFYVLVARFKWTWSAPLPYGKIHRYGKSMESMRFCYIMYYESLFIFITSMKQI